MKILNTILACFAVSAFCQVTQAQWGGTQEITLDFYDREIGGQEELRLKEEIQRQHPYVNLQFAELLSIQLVAKSRHGRASASLLVGSVQSGDQAIYGNPRDWYDQSEWSYSTNTFNNDQRTSQGPWQIIITGNVMVRRVVLSITQRQPRPVPGPRPIPRPGPGNGQEASVYCASSYFNYNTCFVAGHVITARVLQVHSYASCIYGRDWGWNTPYNSQASIWVNNGCEATFRVTIR